jgi:hypothetical protein
VTVRAPQNITIAIPLDAIGTVTMTAPPLRLVWSDSDDATIAIATGMVRAAFVDLLRVMDPEHGRHVLQVSRKRRGVEVDAFVAFLRARYAARHEALAAAPVGARDPEDPAPEPPGPAQWRCRGGP